MRTWKDVATLVKTKSLNGRFVARPAMNLPFLLNEGVEVAFVPPQTDLPRFGRVDFSRDIDGVTFEVGFDSVADEIAAHGLVGCHCLMRCDEIDESAFSDEPDAWVGWRVVELDGRPVGCVESLVDNPGQSLIEVKRDNGAFAYIPAVDAIVCDVDVEQRTITVDLPTGLLDL